MINNKLPFTQKDVERAIKSKIYKNKERAKKELSRLDKSWTTNSQLFLNNLQPEQPEQFLNWSREQISKEKSPSGLILFLPPIFVSFMFLYLFTSSTYDMTFPMFLEWLIEPIISLLTLSTPYNPVEYILHVFFFFVIFLIVMGLSFFITGPLTIFLWEKFIREPLAKSKSNNISKERCNHTKSILRVYASKPLLEFIENRINEQLIPSTIPSDYWNKLINDYNTNKELLNTSKEWQKNYPKASINKIFKLYRELSITKQQYYTRINENSSMIAILPQSYHDSNTLSVLWQLLNEGRADTWKESINLMKTEQFQEQMLYTINNLYHSIDRLTSQLADDGKKLRENLEYSIEQQRAHMSELKKSNHQQNTLLDKNNRIID